MLFVRQGAHLWDFHKFFTIFICNGITFCRLAWKFFLDAGTHCWYFKISTFNIKSALTTILEESFYSKAFNKLIPCEATNLGDCLDMCLRFAACILGSLRRKGGEKRYTHAFYEINTNFEYDRKFRHLLNKSLP